MKSPSLGNVQLLRNPSLSNRQPPARHALATLGLPSCVNGMAISVAQQLQRHHPAPADDSAKCFQAIDLYIAKKVFLFDLLNALLQNAEEVQ